MSLSRTSHDFFAGTYDRKELGATVKAVDRLPEANKGLEAKVPVMTVPAVGHRPTCQAESKHDCRSNQQVITHREVLFLNHLIGWWVATAKTLGYAFIKRRHRLSFSPLSPLWAIVSSTNIPADTSTLG